MESKNSSLEKVWWARNDKLLKRKDIYRNVESIPINSLYNEFVYINNYITLQP